MARLRQAVIAARDLDEVAGRLRAELDLGEPFSDPGVSYFGLRNAVFALGDTFLEIVSPARGGTSAGRLLERRGGDCGYMLMFQVDDLRAARARARSAGVREVFEVAFDDIEEVHLHPSDMRGPIVSLSEVRPPQSWRWGGPDWRERAVPASLASVTMAAPDAFGVAAQWAEVIGEVTEVRFDGDGAREPGLVKIALEAPGASAHAVRVGSVTVVRHGGR